MEVNRSMWRWIAFRWRTLSPQWEEPRRSSLNQTRPVQGLEGAIIGRAIWIPSIPGV